MRETIFQEYEKRFGEVFPKFIPQDEKFAEHCLELNKPIDELPDDDPFIKQYFSQDIIY